MTGDRLLLAALAAGLAWAAGVCGLWLLDAMLHPGAVLTATFFGGHFGATYVAPLAFGALGLVLLRLLPDIGAPGSAALFLGWHAVRLAGVVGLTARAANALWAWLGFGFFDIHGLTPTPWLDLVREFALAAALVALTQRFSIQFAAGGGVVRFPWPSSRGRPLQ